MKITAARVIVCSPGRNFVTLKIETDQGVYGIGDATLNGSQGPLKYPKAENERNPQAWNRMPLVAWHPTEVVNGEKVGTYVSDFSYRECSDGRRVVEDVKSAPTRTSLFRMKRKLMKALYGIEIVEV